MSQPSALARLDEHQSEILTIIQGAEPLLKDTTSRDVAGLARSRWALMRALTAYQLFKHREVFDPLLAKAKPGDAHRLLRMKRACNDLGDEFRGYVQKWSASDVATEWGVYQPAALAMIARIRAHIAQERTAVAGLLRA